MKVSIKVAARDLSSLIKMTNKELKPIYIKSKNGNAVLIAESEWSAIVETLYIFSSLENAKILIDSTLDYQNGINKGKTYSLKDLKNWIGSVN